MSEIRVAKDTLKQTRCESNFSCLTSKPECMCDVNSTVGSILFVKSPSNISCNHCIAYGDSYVCTCPTRNELYNKYRL
jgi:hypothetical protein